ncbi:hypothetical protein HanPI659440_Chr00c04g0712711 [Helianthus annuus]|nr:hypothetical protein HanPI659440_Chr00c04g0712711 [Helianthus annuus]
MGDLKVIMSLICNKNNKWMARKKIGDDHHLAKTLRPSHVTGSYARTQSSQIRTLKVPSFQLDPARGHDE